MMAFLFAGGKQGDCLAPLETAVPFFYTDDFYVASSGNSWI